MKIYPSEGDLVKVIGPPNHSGDTKIPVGFIGEVAYVAYYSQPPEDRHYRFDHPTNRYLDGVPHYDFFALSSLEVLFTK